MAVFLKQSTAIEIKMGPFVDNADGNTIENGLTISQADVRLAKEGGDWAQKNEATTLVHEEAGWYRCLLDTTDTNTLGTLIVAIHESGALPVWREFVVQAANVYDSLVGGGDTLDVQVTGMGAGTVTASAIATDAIDDDAIATGAIAATAFAAGAIDAAAIAANAITSSELADGAITAAKFAAGAITATVIATDAIDADALAANALAEINAEVLDVLNVDSFSEPTGVPAAANTIQAMIHFMYSFMFRNKVTVTATKQTFYDDTDAAEFEKDLADDGTTYTQSEANAL